MLYLRKYKFWKQFTTLGCFFFKFNWLCCIYENTNFESNSQLVSENILLFVCCVVSTKIQILKAIHNYGAVAAAGANVVLYLRKYKFWKQFTTLTALIAYCVRLCCIYENTNFESNSQLTHNICNLWHRLCCIYENTNFESNSQLDIRNQSI